MRLPRWVTGLAWLVFALAVLLPLGQLVWEAARVDGHWDLNPFRELLLTQRQWQLLQNSVLLAGGASSIALILGVPLAFFIQKTDLWGRSLFSLVYLSPLLIPPYIQAIVWSHLLAPESAINAFFMNRLGWQAAPFSAYGLPGASFVLGLAYSPFITLLTISGFKSMERRYEEAALLQQGTWRTLVSITLPLLLPHIIAGTLFVFVFAIIDFGVPDILRVRVYFIEIFIQLSAFYDHRAAIILGLPLLFVTMVLMTLQVWIMRGRSYINLADGFSGTYYYRLGKTQIPSLIVCLLIMSLSVLVPVGALLNMAGPLTTYQQSLSTSWKQIGFSYLMAIVSAGAMTILAFFIAHAMMRSSKKIRVGLEYLTQIPFAVPPMMLGLGLIKIWNRPETTWLYSSGLIILLAYLAHFVPFTIRAVYASLQQVHPSLEEMGWLMSARPCRVIARITLPLVRHGLLTGFFIAFVLAMGELGVTLLILPPGMATIPIKIYNYMHYGAEATVAALCLILLALQWLFSLSLLGFSAWLDKKMA